jgi:hypothetical protein
MADLRYPIGQFDHTGEVTGADVSKWIDEVAALPQRLRDAVAGLDELQLDTPYRPEGWTVRQVVHHVPESHMNSYIRFRWALTEDKPTIKPYDEAACAELVDSRTAPIEPSLTLLDAVHARWVIMLHALTPEQLRREFVHPESGVTTLERTIGMYAWHGNHHVTHITALRERERW